MPPSGAWVQVASQDPRAAPRIGRGKRPTLLQASMLYCWAIAIAALQHSRLLAYTQPVSPQPGYSDALTGPGDAASKAALASAAVHSVRRIAVASPGLRE